MYDELVKRLRETAGAFDYDGRPDIACDYEQAADAIEELQGRAKVLEKLADKWCEAVPKWILVTERLPRYGDWVLGIGPKRGYHVCEFRGITHFPYSGDSPWFSAKGRSITVTHWMPLPPAPKEETIS